MSRFSRIRHIPDGDSESHIPGHIPGLLVVALWATTAIGITADVLIKSETSWVADLVRDLTHVCIGLGVAALMMWHRERTGARPTSAALLTRATTYGVHLGWRLRGQLDAARENAEVVQLRPWMDVSPLRAGQLMGSDRHE